MFQTAVLASGSKGNCSLVKTDKTAVLIDAGLSFVRICSAMNQLSLDPQSIEAVVVSHEHSDHIKGIGPLCRKLKIPLFITKDTFEASRLRNEKLPADVEFFKSGDNFHIGDLRIHPFPSSHDAVDSCNFVITQEETEINSIPLPIDQKTDATVTSQHKLGVVTDLGFCSKLLINKLKNITTIILESNHDYNMLMSGCYPWHLKQRVKSINGHLSNEQAIGLISQILHPGLENIILAHLSEENNRPQIVEDLFLNYLTTIRSNTHLTISTQHSVTPLINV